MSAEGRTAPPREERRLPHRLAVATLVAAVPLIVFGGSVTSLDAGMAIDGWWVLEPGRGDHFLLAYPIDKWFRDAGTFVEHTHRLCGMLVGLLAIATLVAAFAARLPRAARVVSAAALLAVCGQGTLGGFRVLENSPDLAFLHGAFGQLVFALLAAQVALTSPRWGRVEPAAPETAGGLRRAAAAAPVAVYLAIFAGAWLRHGGAFGALVVHLVAVVAAAVAILVLASRLRAAADGEELPADSRALLRGVRARLLGLAGAQVLLGLGAFWIVFVAVGPSVQEVHQSLLPTLHVLFGALLLAQSVSAALWSRRAVSAGARARVALAGGAS